MKNSNFNLSITHTSCCIFMRDSRYPINFSLNSAARSSYKFYRSCDVYIILLYDTTTNLKSLHFLFEGLRCFIEVLLSFLNLTFPLQDVVQHYYSLSHSLTHSLTLSLSLSLTHTHVHISMTFTTASHHMPTIKNYEFETIPCMHTHFLTNIHTCNCVHVRPLAQPTN